MRKLNHIIALDSEGQERQIGLAMRDNILGQIGSLQVRLAEHRSEVEAVQKMRFGVFRHEFGVSFDAAAIAAQRDADEFDAYCDHLIVLDTDIIGGTAEQIVGTYRLMRADQARRAGRYYSADEFSVASLIERQSNRRFLELGRSCVMPAYRSKRTIELLWQGIWAYCQEHNVDVMMGCASFAGTLPAAHAEPLSFLNNYARVDEKWHIAPVPGRHVTMDLMPSEAINTKSALSRLPALIKGYLRVGALFGDGAVIDPAFNSIDVMVVLPIENISQRYKTYYGPKIERFAA